MKYIHASRCGDITEISAHGNFPGLFTLPEDEAHIASQYGSFYYEIEVYGEVWDSDDLSSEMDDNWEKIEAYIASVIHVDASEEIVERLIEVAKGDIQHDDNEAMEALNAIDYADFYREAQILRMNVAAMLGASAVQMVDEFNGLTIAVLAGGDYKISIK